MCLHAGVLQIPDLDAAFHTSDSLCVLPRPDMRHIEDRIDREVRLRSIAKNTQFFKRSAMASGSSCNGCCASR